MGTLIRITNPDRYWDIPMPEEGEIFKASGDNRVYIVRNGQYVLLRPSTKTIDRFGNVVDVGSDYRPSDQANHLDGVAGALQLDQFVEEELGLKLSQIPTYNLADATYWKMTSGGVTTAREAIQSGGRVIPNQNLSVQETVTNPEYTEQLRSGGTISPELQAKMSGMQQSLGEMASSEANQYLNSLGYQNAGTIYQDGKPFALYRPEATGQGDEKNELRIPFTADQKGLDLSGLNLPGMAGAASPLQIQRVNYQLDQKILNNVASGQLRNRDKYAIFLQTPVINYSGFPVTKDWMIAHNPLQGHGGHDAFVFNPKNPDQGFFINANTPRYNDLAEYLSLEGRKASLSGGELAQYFGEDPTGRYESLFKGRQAPNIDVLEGTSEGMDFNAIIQGKALGKNIQQDPRFPGIGYGNNSLIESGWNQIVDLRNKSKGTWHIDTKWGHPIDDDMYKQQLAYEEKFGKGNFMFNAGPETFDNKLDAYAAIYKANPKVLLNIPDEYRNVIQDPRFPGISYGNNSLIGSGWNQIIQEPLQGLKFQESEAYKTLAPEVRNFVDIAYRLMEGGNAEDATQFSESIKQAQRNADPYTRAQMGLALAEVRYAVAQKAMDPKTQSEVLKDIRKQMMSTIGPMSDMPLDKQGEIGRLINEYDGDMLTLADRSGVRLSLGLGADASSSGIIQSTRRRDNLNFGELRMRAAKGDPDAQTQLDSYRARRSFKLPAIGRITSDILRNNRNIAGTVSSITDPAGKPLAGGGDSLTDVELT